MSVRIDVAHRLIASLVGRPTHGDEFGATVAAAMREVMPFDGWCLIGLDPRNHLRTFQFGGPGLEGATANAANEHRMRDVNLYSDLARSDVPVGWLSSMHPAAAQSFRLNEMMLVQGVHSELRAVLRDDQGTWGALVMFRDHAARTFGADEVALVLPLLPTLTRAVRRHPVRPGEPVAPLLPGVVLVAPDCTALRMSEPARSWLDDLVPGGEDQTWPEDVTRVLLDAAHSVQATGSAAHSCIRTVSGRWLSVAAAPMDEPDADIAVTLSAAPPTSVLDLVQRHHGLTAREAVVAAAVLRGLAAKQVARRLGITVWTVNDHLGSIYRKVGVTSRDAFLALLH